MKICTGRKGGGNPRKFPCRISRWRSFCIELRRIFIGRVIYFINCSVFFEFWRRLVFFRESRFSIDAIFYRKNEDSGNLVTESSDWVVQRSWRVHLVYLCGFDCLNDDTSSVVSIVFRILENVTFDGLHYCNPPFAFAFHRDSYPVWKYLHFLVHIIYPNTINYFAFVSLDYFIHLIILSDFSTLPILKL